MVMEHKISSHIFVDTNDEGRNEEYAKILAGCVREYCDEAHIPAREILVTPMGYGEFDVEINVRSDDAVNTETIFTQSSELFRERIERNGCCCGKCKNCKCK